MSEISIEKRLGELERRFEKVRGYLIDFTSMALATLVPVWVTETYKPPSGFAVFGVLFVFFYWLVRRVTRWLLR